MKQDLNPRIEIYSFRSLAALSSAAALIVINAAALTVFDYFYKNQYILLTIAASPVMLMLINIDLLFILMLYKSKMFSLKVIESDLIARNLLNNHIINMADNFDVLIKCGHKLIGGNSSAIWCECGVSVDNREEICITSFIKNAPRLIEEISAAHIKRNFDESYRKIERGSAVAFRPVWICGSTLIVNQSLAINLNEYNGCAIRDNMIVLNPITGSRTVEINLDKTENSHLLYMILCKILGCANSLSDRS